MKAILKENWIFIVGYFCFLLSGLVLLTQIEKGDVIFYFAENRTDFLNLFFIKATQLGEGIGYALFGIIFLFIRFRYTILLAFVAGSVTICAAIFKNFFGHPRPKPYFAKLGQDISDLAVTGQPLLESNFSSFPSGHTMSGFAFFTILAILSQKNGLKILCLILAILIGTSRIYLVHHFLEDILLGSFFGVLLAFILQYFHLKLDMEKDIWWNKRVSGFRFNRSND
jgi:membrane-associated phospholipid phosphatase